MLISCYMPRKRSLEMKAIMHIMYGPIDGP
jgi:hypothetical protein